MSANATIVPSSIIDDTKVVKESGASLAKVKVGDDTSGPIPGLGTHLKGVHASGRRLVLLPNRLGGGWYVVCIFFND